MSRRLRRTGPFDAITPTVRRRLRRTGAQVDATASLEAWLKTGAEAGRR